LRRRSFQPNRHVHGRAGPHDWKHRLSEIPNLVAIKKASGSMDQVSDILRLCGDRLTILSGDDALTVKNFASPAAVARS